MVEQKAMNISRKEVNPRRQHLNPRGAESITLTYSEGWQPQDMSQAFYGVLSQYLSLQMLRDANSLPAPAAPARLSNAQYS